MGYGFCLDPNPTDTFNLSYSPALVKHIELALTSSGTASQINVSHHQTQDTHRIGLLPTVSNIPASDTHVPNFPDYSISQGFLTDFSLLLRNDREKKHSSPFHNPPPDTTSFSATSLTRNKLHVLSSFIMVLQDKRAAIRKNDLRLPAKPQNQRQEYAAIYRQSQLDILEGILVSLERTLVSITAHPRPGVESSSMTLSNNSAHDQDRPRNGVIAVRDVVGADSHVSSGAIATQGSSSRLTPHVRAVIHAGLRTRDPDRIVGRNGEEFAFAMWICGLRLVLDSNSDEGAIPDTDITLTKWLKRLEEWYPLPSQPQTTSTTTSLSDQTNSANDSNIGKDDGNPTEHEQEERRKRAKRDHDVSEDEAVDLYRTATSYRNVLDTVIKKHPDSLFNDRGAVTLDRLAWCIAVVSGEGVRIPRLLFVDRHPSSQGFDGNSSSHAAMRYPSSSTGGGRSGQSGAEHSGGNVWLSEWDEDGSGDEFVLVVEVD